MDSAKGIQLFRVDEHGRTQCVDARDREPRWGITIPMYAHVDCWSEEQPGDIHVDDNSDNVDDTSDKGIAH
jgi:hypothetical protein